MRTEGESKVPGQGKTLIISLGGSPEPVIASLCHHRPEHVCFLTSQKAIDSIGQIKQAVGGKGLSFDDYKVIVEDPQDLVECYEKALRCAEWAKGRSGGEGEVVVDYTGGTKAMSAGLALATVRHGYRFSYVGGEKRTKQGVGVVESGNEKLFVTADPWELFAVEGKRKAALYFNTFRFDAAADELAGIARKPGARQPLFEDLERAARGYAAWDRFRHGEAVELLGRVEKSLPKLAEVAAGSELRAFCETLAANVGFLKRLRDRTDNFKRVAAELVVDVVANARRRVAEGKFDDAVARIYRALEMIGQVRFTNRFRVTTSRCPASVLPEALRDEFKAKYARKDDPEELQFGLDATFRVLKQIGDEVGKQYFDRKDDLGKILSARNSSIMAHGSTPVKEETALEFLRIVSEMLDGGYAELDFPRFPWA